MELRDMRLSEKKIYMCQDLSPMITMATELVVSSCQREHTSSDSMSKTS